MFSWLTDYLKLGIELDELSAQAVAITGSRQEAVALLELAVTIGKLGVRSEDEMIRAFRSEYRFDYALDTIAEAVERAKDMK